MELAPRICDRARLARDPRFDGRFFVGVLTTGIFCRPICPARPPKAANVRFFPTAAAATRAGLRPCLRCRPESAPGTPAWDGTCSTVARALRQISNGALDGGGVEDLARAVGVGARQLNRLFHQHLGASPVAIAQTRRLLFAKKLLNETDLKIADLAFAAGFGSVRRFNDLFARTYRQKPSEMRRSGLGRAGGSLPGGAVELVLAYRQPFDWRALLDFLAPRAIPAVEEIEGDVYRRNVALGEATGRIEVRSIGNALALSVDFPDSEALLTIASRVRRLFDLDSDPSEVAAGLSCDPLLRPLVRKREGLRVPGAWDGFELAVRAVLGQQVTVRGATTLAGRLVRAYGRQIDSGMIFPRPADLVRARFSSVGLPKTRAAAIRRLSRACAEGELRLEPGADPDRTVRTLAGIPGIGDWTAQYIAMRALGEPDACPTTDLVLLKAATALSGPDQRTTSARLRAMAEPWRPWRAYAAMHLWRWWAEAQRTAA